MLSTHNKQKIMTFLGLNFYALVASADMIDNPAISLVLDGYYQTQNRALSERIKGFGLGETELALSANVDDKFFGKLTTVLEANSQNTEILLEEAFIQTLALPAGFTIRGGRFLSDVGYLNRLHLHTDSFVERPAPYRAFLGGHYFDDGLSGSYLFPTDLYWSVGIEAFKGDKLRAEGEDSHFDTVGVYTFNTKFGNDFGDDSSWQLGLSYLRNENGRLIHHDNDGDADHHDEDGHSHNVAYTGENTYIADFVYKWAPDGNYKYQHLTLSGEYFKVTDVLPHGETSVYDDYDGWYVSSVYQLSPQWSTGLRYSEISTFIEDENEQFDKQRLREADVMLAWHHSHFSTLRFQYSRQSTTHFSNTEENVFTLQYVMTLGAHGAHQF